MVGGDAVPGHPSRRELLAGAAAAGGALILAGCGGSGQALQLDTHPNAPTLTRPDPTAAAAAVPVLTAALELERHTVAAYTAGIPLLDPAQAQWARTLLAEELRHTGELIGLLQLAGAKVPPPAGTYAIGHPRDGDELFEVLIALEERQLEGYARGIPRLAAGPMRAVAASVFANDAQHIAGLRRAVGRDPLGPAWVAGAPGVVTA